MTRKELIELNAKVAANVMGWRRMTWAQAGQDARKTRKMSPYWYDDKNRRRAFAVNYSSFKESIEEMAWDPSADISAAWEVIEKLV